MSDQAKAAAPSTVSTRNSDAMCMTHPIAIVGLAGRYPKAPDLDTLWKNLTDGLDAVTEAKGERWDIGHTVPGSTDTNRVYTAAGGFLDRIDLFDAEFFGMSPREAKQVDPQHRLMLELTWEALESAGIVPASVTGSCSGVFIGLSANDYAQLNLSGDEAPNAYTNIGSAISICSNRISYIFDFHGPSMSIDTACSSSMVAIHQACQALAHGEIGMAVAGGVNILVSPRPFVGFSRASMLSPDGRCKSFDASGNGYVRAEGGGILILKRLEDAERDGDPILAVVRATAVNSDGRTMGLALPNGDAQEALLRQVYGASGVAAEDVFYVEAHGTGTAAGDPIECGAIGRVLGAPRNDGSVCHMGSVKSNIGHLESGAGIAGLTKVLLSLRHRTLPANLHFNTPNPKIEFDEWKLKVVDQPVPLPDREKPLVFGINSFGFGGTNAHMVLQEYRPANDDAARSATQRPLADWDGFLVLSAHNQGALEALADDYIARLEKADEAQWLAIRAASLRARSLHPLRLAVPADSAAEAAERLKQWREDAVGSAIAARKYNATIAAGTQKLAFVFSGNGPQWWGMGRELLAECPPFREALQDVDTIFAPLSGWSLIDRMSKPEEETEISLTEIAQPLLFAQQVALVKVLAKAGIIPSAVFGHSVGEAAAAWASGALSLDQATRVIYHRSQQQAKTRGAGRMAAIGLSRKDAEATIAALGLGDDIEIAAVNSAKAVTVAGPLAGLEKLEAHLTEQSQFVRILPLEYAFHTRAMDPIRQPLLDALAGLEAGQASVPFVSTVSGDVLEGPELGTEYWWSNIREPVAFDAGAKTVIETLGISCFLEVGPHPVLKDYVLQVAKAIGASGVSALNTLRRPSSKVAAPEMSTLRQAIADVYAAGGGSPVAMFPVVDRTLKLPAFPWQRQRHWRGRYDLPDAIVPVERDHGLLGARAPGADGVWTNTIQTVLQPHLKDHVIQDMPLFPAAGYIEMMLAAGRWQTGSDQIVLESLEIQRPLVLADGAEPIAQTTIDSADGTVHIRSRLTREADEWTVHAKCRASKLDGLAPTRINPLAIRNRMANLVDNEQHYAECARRGLHYGPMFQGLRFAALTSADQPQREVFAEISLDWIDDKGLEDNFAHPAMVDGALQALVALIANGDNRACATIPVFVERLICFGRLGKKLWCHGRLVSESSRSGVADIDLADMEGNIVLSLKGARFQKVEFKPATLTLMAEDWRIDPDWQPRPQGDLALPELASLTDQAGLVARTDDTLVSASLDRLVGAYGWQAIRTLAPDLDSFTIANLAVEGEVAEEQRPMLRAIVAMAEADGLLSRDESTGRWSVTEEANAPQPGALVRELMLARPEWVAELVAVSAAGSELAARLRGEAEPRIAMAEILEDGAPGRESANRALAQMVQAIVAAWPKGRAIRILECDGRHGGLTAAVLPHLPPERCDYLFTDSDEGLVGRAEHRFARHHFVRTATYAEDSVPDEAFDLVLTSRFEDAARLARHLVPGGLIVGLHALPSRMATLIHGSTESTMAASAGELGEMLTVKAVEGPLGAELVVARRSAPATAAMPEIAADGRKRTLVLTQAEAGTAYVEALAQALSSDEAPVRMRVIGPDDLTDEAMERLVAEEDADEFVHLAGWNRTADPESADALLAYEDLRCFSLVALARAIEQHQINVPDRAGPMHLRVVTRGALATMARGPLDPFQATALGLVRVLLNEMGGLKAKVLDVHASADDAVAGLDTARALLSAGDESEMQLADGMRLIARVREASHSGLARISGKASAGEAFRLACRPQGGLDSLHLTAIERKAPGADEVEVRVAAAGLNFRDVLWTMGMLPEEAVEHGFSGATIGMECSGIVERVGADVTHVKPGDRVMGFASSTFGTHVTTRADGLGLLPDNLGLVEAATIPTTFITAWYALDHLARLRKGETVLIHGAAGGVGLAALQIAKLKGATVFATAGSADKQRLVRDMGADHVLSSRSLAFAEDIMRLTDGKGVDVVLNSLAGEAITRGLSLLKPFGRFLEIGKRDLYANSRIGLRPFRQNLSYFGIDADTLLVERAELAAELFAEISALFASGALRPLPHQTFPIARSDEAFRLMQASKHIGKIVITLPEADGRAAPMVPAASLSLPKDGPFVVTGGLAGFGLTTAQWLAENGVSQLALMGRRGAATEEAEAALAAFAAAGVKVKPIAVDVADRAALAAALDEVRAEFGPIRGVVHAAAVIEDAPVIMIQRDLCHRVQSAKMQGAWNLHELTRNDPIEAFVLYSSSSAVVGNPGQGIYVGANLFLDALAQLRRAEGLPALSVGWGAIKGAGFLTRNTHVEEMLENRAGMAATPVQDALAELGRLLTVDATRVAASQFNLMRLGQSLPGTRLPRFSKLVPQGVSVSGDQGSTLAAALEAMSEEERMEVLTNLVREQVARVIGAAASQIEADRTLAEMGLDSLMAVELAESLEQEIGKPVSVMQMIQAGTINGVVSVVMRGFKAQAAEPAPAAAAPVADAA